MKRAPLFLLCSMVCAAPATWAKGYLAPVDVKSLKSGKELLVLGSTGRRAYIVERISGRKTRLIRLPAAATGAAVRRDTAYVATAEPAGRILAVDLVRGTIQKQWRVGHTPMAPTLSPDGRTLYVANRFSNNIAMIDLAGDAQRIVGVVREPVALALGADGSTLFVANHLPCVRPALDEENPFIAAEISVVDTAAGLLVRNIQLPNGSQGLRGIACSPDGKYVAVTHVLSHYMVPVMRIEKGAINMNALSLIDARTQKWIETIILDDPERGAANPWAVTFSGDGRRLLVTLAGTHELSVIDFPALLKRIKARKGATGLYGEEALPMLAGIRTRLQLPINGARALIEMEGAVYVPGFFSDTLAQVELTAREPAVKSIALEETPPAASKSRLGEQYFNDATFCFQQWQSCASCHPDGRSDSLYWDLLNDGVGNTKNTKSLVLSAQTPPVMWRGVRPDSATAVLAGIHHIQFAMPRAGQVEALDEYLRTMPIVPSPYLNAAVPEPAQTKEASCARCHRPGVPRGMLTNAARRGKALFEGPAGCAACHPHPAFTNLKQVDPGLGTGVLYDVPSLIEVWRTAPYLHSGEALTLRETITNFNFMQKRGHTKELSDEELNDLLEYLKSL